jgi:5-methylcytosine-specific restriction endonuclease McrA
MVMIKTEYVMRRGRRIPVSELSDTSGYKVEVECPECLKIRIVFLRSVRAAGHTVCQACSMKKLSIHLPVGARYGSLSILGQGKETGYSICKCDCGTIKEVSNDSLGKGQKSCGCIKVHNFDQVNRPTGEKHGNWKGGVSSERSRTMASKKYKDWKKEVFENSGHKCRKCGSENKLMTHHIEDYKTSTKRRVDIENGAVLCMDCHNEFHRLYGKHNTNHQQFEAFIG